MQETTKRLTWAITALLATLALPWTAHAQCDPWLGEGTYDLTTSRLNGDTAVTDLHVTVYNPGTIPAQVTLAVTNTVVFAHHCQGTDVDVSITEDFNTLPDCGNGTFTVPAESSLDILIDVNATSGARIQLDYDGQGGAESVPLVEAHYVRVDTIIGTNVKLFARSHVIVPRRSCR